MALGVVDVLELSDARLISNVEDQKTVGFSDESKVFRFSTWQNGTFHN